MLPTSVSQEKAADEALFEQTLEQAIDAVVVIDEHNRVTFFNPAAERLWGLPRDEVLGRNVSMLVPTGIRDAHDGYVAANRATGINRIVGTSREVPVERRDGTRLWASMSISRVAIGPRVLYTAFLHDVTQQQRLRQLSLVADHSGSAIAVTGADLRITYVNEGFTRLLGYESHEALGQRPGRLARGPHTDMQAIGAMRDCILAGEEVQSQALIYARDGRPLWVSVVLNPVHDAAGALEHLVLVLTDVTHTKIHEVLQHKVLDAMAHGAPLRDVALLLCREIELIAPEVTASLLEVDADGRLQVLAAPSLPPAIEHLMNGADAATGQPAPNTDISADVSADTFAADPHWAPVQGAFAAHGLRACWTHPVKDRDGAVLGTLAFYFREPRSPNALHQRLADVCLHLCALLLKRERERSHIHQLAYYDPLTGLANRRMLHAQTERLLHEARRRAAPLALVFIDLDRFKQVNDTLGHTVGDALLCALAARLQDNTRPGDLAGRMGGDEFVLALSQCDADEAASAAKRLLAALAQPVDVQGATLHPRVSLGIAMHPEDGADADTLLRCADLAMYQAKTAGGQGYRFYSAEMNAQVQEGARQGGLVLRHYRQV